VRVRSFVMAVLPPGTGWASEAKGAYTWHHSSRLRLQVRLRHCLFFSLKNRHRRDDTEGYVALEDHPRRRYGESQSLEYPIARRRPAFQADLQIRLRIRLT
jgi:hypothetical protein